MKYDRQLTSVRHKRTEVGIFGCPNYILVTKPNSKWMYKQRKPNKTSRNTRARYENDPNLEVVPDGT